MAEYNIKTVVCFSLIIIGIIWIFIGAVRGSDKQMLRIVYSILCCLIVIALTVIMLLFVSYRSCEITGTVNSISCTGSWAGIMDTYTVDIVDDSVDSIQLHTSLFSSSGIKKSVDAINIGDKVFVCYGGYFDMIHDVNIIESN